jgi:hypothetical protein
MNWEAIGVTAELLGAIGVIATLVYLARQINQNTSTVRASAAAALSETNTGLSALLAQDAEINRLWWACLRDRESLSEAEQLRSDALIATYLGVIEQSHDFYAEGAITNEKRDARDARLAWLVTQPGFAAFWESYGATYAKSFMQRVEQARYSTLNSSAA